MALYLSQYIDNPLSYNLWPGFYNPDPGYVWDKYNPYLRTLPRIYDESITSIKGFFYVPPPKDIFVLWTMGVQTTWPSWNINYWRFDGQTGAFIERSGSDDELSFTYIGSVEWGDFGHLYATLGSTTNLYQINWETGALEGSSWMISPYSWNPIRRIFSYYMVNRTNDKILAQNYPYLEIWKDVYSGTPTREWYMKLPTGVKDLAYESNNYGWVLMDNGGILKVDWNTKRRVELFSSIQAYNPTDKGNYIAYDSLRKRLACYRWLSDATNGAAQNRIEFYETVPKPQILTSPVPVTRHRANDYVKLSANIVGSVGEGFAGASAIVELVSPGNHGQVISPNANSGKAGDIAISYKAPNTEITVEDTIKLTVNYEDDITIEGD